METQKKTSPTIKDLITINNDRYEGYKTASEETKDSDLKSMFTEFSQQSKKFAQELRKFVPADDNQPGKDETKNSGKVYRAWMDVKAAVTNKDRKAILSSCEFGEDTAKKHYQEAMDHTSEIPSEAIQAIQKQRMDIQKAHDKVKAMRDASAK